MLVSFVRVFLALGVGDFPSVNTRWSHVERCGVTGLTEDFVHNLKHDPAAKSFISAIDSLPKYWRNAWIASLRSSFRSV